MIKIVGDILVIQYNGLTVREPLVLGVGGGGGHKDEFPSIWGFGVNFYERDIETK